MVETVIKYEGNLRCRSNQSTTHAVILTDAPKDHHGLGEGFSPSELLSVSLGSCILSIMGINAQSIGADITGSTATVTKEMANSPRRIATISVVVRVSNPMNEKQRRALEAAAHACPVHAVLGIDVPIRFDWDAHCHSVEDRS